MNQATPKTNFAELVGDLNGGVYEQQINAALSDIAANVCTHGKKGELTLKLTIQQIGDSHQVKVTHSLKSVTPKARGKVTEEHAVDTPLHVGKGGRLSLYPVQETFKEMGAGAATGRTDGERTPMGDGAGRG